MRLLAASKMAADAIPSGGGLADGIAFLSELSRVVESAKKSQVWAKDAVNAVRNAGEPNPYKGCDDEQIAEMILKEVKKRR